MPAWYGIKQVFVSVRFSKVQNTTLAFVVFYSCIAWSIMFFLNVFLPEPDTKRELRKEFAFRLVGVFCEQKEEFPENEARFWDGRKT